jgi:hypothetical protein
MADQTVAEAFDRVDETSCAQVFQTLVDAKQDDPGNGTAAVKNKLAEVLVVRPKQPVLATGDMYDICICSGRLHLADVAHVVTSCSKV